MKVKELKYKYLQYKLTPDGKLWPEKAQIILEHIDQEYNFGNVPSNLVRSGRGSAFTVTLRIALSPNTAVTVVSKGITSGFAADRYIQITLIVAYISLGTWRIGSQVKTNFQRSTPGTALERETSLDQGEINFLKY